MKREVERELKIVQRAAFDLSSSFKKRLEVLYRRRYKSREHFLHCNGKNMTGKYGFISDKVRVTGNSLT